MQDEQIWTPQAQNKSDLETIKTTVDTETDLPSGRSVPLRLHKSICTYVFLLVRKKWEVCRLWVGATLCG